MFSTAYPHAFSVSLGEKEGENTNIANKKRLLVGGMKSEVWSPVLRLKT